MLQELNNLRDEAKNVNFPIDGDDMEKAGSVINLLIVIGKLVKKIWKKSGPAIDHIISILQGISTGAMVIHRVKEIENGTT